MRSFVFLLVLAGALAAEYLNVTTLNLYPEGIEYQASTDLFLISSVQFGTISKINPTTGAVVSTISDSQLTLIGSLGLQIDVSRDRLYVAQTDSKQFFGTQGSTFAALSIFRLSDGTRVQWVNLTKIGGYPSTFPNDVTMDAAGNLYVTESFNGLIMKVDGTTFVPSVFASSSAWTPVSASPVGINGIEYVATGNYLIVGNTGTGKLFKVTIATPPVITEITLTENGAVSSALGTDGLFFHPQGALISSSAISSTALVSSDNWATAKIIGRVTSQVPDMATCTVRNNVVYAMHSHITNIFGTNANNTRNFEIEILNLPGSGVSALMPSLAGITLIIATLISSLQ